MEVIANGGEVTNVGSVVVKNEKGSINGSASLKKNRIQVSNTKKPLFFYVNLAKKYMRLHEEVELSALGMAIATVVTIAEILKNNGFAIEKKILTSTVGMKDENRGKLVQKAKIEILLGKSENFENLVTDPTPTPPPPPPPTPTPTPVEAKTTEENKEEDSKA